MAIVTPNGPRANAGEVRQFLNFAKELFSSNTVKAISLLIHPCCPYDPISAEVECEAENVYTVTLRYGQSLPSQPSLDGAFLIVRTSGGDTISLSANANLIDNKTIQFSNVVTTPGTFNLINILLFPVSPGPTGITVLGGIASVEFPAC